MAVKNNPVLGSVKCNGCSGEATVHQTQRGKGRFLYTRCTECGPDQRSGKAVQTRLWNETQWREGQKPEAAPPNVTEKAAQDWKPGQPAESSPQVEKPAKQQPAEKQTTPEKSGNGGFVILGLAGLAVGGIALAMRKKPAKQQTEPAPMEGSFSGF